MIEEYNYYPLTVKVPQDTEEPQFNMTAGAISASNIIPSANGTIMTGGTMQSPSFSPGNSGWKIDSNGDVEFNDGTFRGQLVANTGTIGGFNIGEDYVRDVANSMGLSATVTGGDDVRFWAGGTFANRASANFRIYESGNVSIDYGADLTLIQGGDINFTSVTAPTACTASLVTTGTGNIDNGNHTYVVTFITSSGETELGVASNTVTVDGTHKQVSLTSIPISSSSAVTARKIYRDKIGVQGYFLLTTISDNSTTSYTDNTADASLTGTAITNRDNTTFGKIKMGGVGALSLGFNNSFVGQYSGNAITSGYRNTGIGHTALYANTSGYDNTSLGYASLYNNTTAIANTAIGSFSLNANLTGQGNTAVGYNTLYNNTANWNNALGYAALITNTSGDYNVAVGNHSLFYNSTGASNVAIGSYAGFYETGSDKLFIDNDQRASEADGRVKALIYGVFDAAVNNQVLHVNGVFFPLSSTTASAPSYVEGAIYYDTTLHKLRVGGAAGWETITSV